MATLESIYLTVAQKLIPVADDLSKSEAQEILETVLEIEHSMFFNNFSLNIPENQQMQISEILNKRLTGKPLAYVLKKQFFYSKDFKLSKATLIPRHDTEHLIDEILTNERDNNLTFLELGTGSGIIPEVITSETDDSKAISVDLSIGALKIAKQNCSNRVSLIASDKFSSIKDNHQFDFIVSNPPYIPSDILINLEKSVIDYEPTSALDGGIDGLTFYRYLAIESPKYLKNSGRLYLEIGYDQGESVPKLLRDTGWIDIKVRKDFANRDRVVSAKFIKQ